MRPNEEMLNICNHMASELACEAISDSDMTNIHPCTELLEGMKVKSRQVVTHQVVTRAQGSPRCSSLYRHCPHVTLSE